MTADYAPKRQAYTRPNTWSPGLFTSFQDAYFARQSPARSLHDLPSPIDSESFSILGFQLHNPLPPLSSLKLHSFDLPVDQTRQVPLDGLLRHLGSFAAPPIQTSYATRLSADRFVAGSATRTTGGHPIPLDERQYATWTSNYKPKFGHLHEANSGSAVSASPLLHQEKKWKYPPAPPQSGSSILAPQIVLQRPSSSSLQWVVNRTKTMHRLFRSRSSSKKAHVSPCDRKLRTPKYRRVEPLDSLLQAPVSALAATQTGFEYCSFEQLTAEP
ncbi:hypothetical protein HOO65_040384 [Ceratocystis lukuohia]|uniref:Uncharacterized protein n=1 Tax=Ceratocystis lukuohia TaxID=2019550 RepID=A0ABR4MIF5_9PEZI